MAVIHAFHHCDGTKLTFEDFLKIPDNGRDMISAMFFKKYGCHPSGPGILPGFKSRNFSSTIWGIIVNASKYSPKNCVSSLGCYWRTYSASLPSPLPLLLLFYPASWEFGSYFLFSFSISHKTNISLGIPWFLQRCLFRIEFLNSWLMISIRF